MATPEVDHSRISALVPRIERLGAEPTRRESVALGLVDALLAGDTETLTASLDALRNARAKAEADQELIGWLDAAIAFVYWGLERVPSQAAVARGTQAHDFLRVLEGSPQLGSTELRRLLETDETQVSRTGRRLLESGLVTRRKLGRQVFWHLTPRGRRELDEAPASQSSGSAFWQEALRRGFEGAHGDQPGEPRKVDPTREHIIESTLQLHGAQGIQATTRPEIAEKAGVPLETIDELFPTFDDLVTGCAQHFMESLQLPPADRAPDVFAGASSETQRVHRLVETVFGVYERGAAGLTAGRRERNAVRVVDESMKEVENSFEALAAEALRPLDPGSDSVASMRAFTDLEVWRALRDQGATPDAAVEQASTAVERWLEAQPAR